MADIGIPASLLQRYFSAYGTQSPLEAAITPEKVQNALAAIGQFQDTRKAQAQQELARQNQLRLQAASPDGEGGPRVETLKDLIALRKYQAETREKGEAELEKIRTKVAGWNKERAEKAEKETEKRKGLSQVQALEKKYPELKGLNLETPKEAINYLRFRKGLMYEPNYGPSPGTGGGIAPTISPQDKAAFEWAKSNPNDPRATGIMLKLKQKGL